MRGNRQARCATCPRFGPIAGRGMCGSCYWKARVNDTLIDHERVTRSTEETIAEWEFLASEGYDRTLAAQRMGMSREALCRAIQRHAKKIAEAA